MGRRFGRSLQIGKLFLMPFVLERRLIALLLKQRIVDALRQGFVLLLGGLRCISELLRALNGAVEARQIRAASYTIGIPGRCMSPIAII